jgi:DTW domain-containing protein YfiP
MNEPLCPTCRKPTNLCVCALVKPLDNRIFVLILQHPQEQDRELGSAQLLAAQLKNSKLAIGLSWRNLGAALSGRKGASVKGAEPDPKRWAVLFLGTAKTLPVDAEEIVALSRKGLAMPDQREALSGIEGIIALDGSWAQAKALWWRNPWLLKCRRVILNPKFRSRYGNLRREPRLESLSTLESVALVLGFLQKQPELMAILSAPFEEMLRRYRARKGAAKAARNKSAS